MTACYQRQISPRRRRYLTAGKQVGDTEKDSGNGRGYNSAGHHHFN